MFGQRSYLTYTGVRVWSFSGETLCNVQLRMSILEWLIIVEWFSLLRNTDTPALDASMNLTDLSFRNWRLIPNSDQTHDELRDCKSGNVCGVSILLALAFQVVANYYELLVTISLWSTSLESSSKFAMTTSTCKAKKWVTPDLLLCICGLLIDTFISTKPIRALQKTWRRGSSLSPSCMGSAQILRIDKSLVCCLYPFYIFPSFRETQLQTYSKNGPRRQRWKSMQSIISMSALNHLNTHFVCWSP